jgi:hypothetical protein
LAFQDEIKRGFTVQRMKVVRLALAGFAVAGLEAGKGLRMRGNCLCLQPGGFGEVFDLARHGIFLHGIGR